MTAKARREALEKILPRIGLSRRRFVSRIVGGAFVTPLVTSFSLDRLTFGGSMAYAQAGNMAPNMGPNIAPTVPKFTPPFTLPSFTAPVTTSAPFCVPENPVRRRVKK